MRPILLILAVALLACIVDAAPTGKAVLYYIPFQIETYQPVTLENIKEKAKYTINVADADTITALMGLVSRGDPGSKWDGKRVRLLIEMEDGKPWAAVDADGNVFDGNASRTLSSKGMAELTAKLTILVEQRNGQ